MRPLWDDNEIETIHTGRVGCCYASRSKDFGGSESVNIGWTPGLGRQEITFPKVLQENGCTTGLVGRWMVGGSSKELWSNELKPKDKPRDPEIKQKLLEKDPVERNDLSKSHPDVADQLYRQLQAWKKAMDVKDRTEAEGHTD